MIDRAAHPRFSGRTGHSHIIPPSNRADTYVRIERKIRTRLDLLSIPQSGGKMSKRLAGIIGCKYNNTSSWHLNGFPDGSNIGSTVCTYVCCCFLHINRSGLNRTLVANPVRDLLDRQRSEEHLQSSNESIKNKKSKQNKITKQNRNDKKKGTITKYTCQKKMEEGHSIERVWYNASREPSDTGLGSQQAPKRVASTTLRTLRVSVYSNGKVAVAS